MQPVDPLAQQPAVPHSACPSSSASRRGLSSTSKAALTGAGLALLAVYTFSPAETGFFPPCIIHAATGLYCPGCGATRSLHALLHGDLAAAASHNLLFVALFPLIAALAVLQLVSLIRDNRFQAIRFPTWASVALLAVMLSFAVVRNLPLEWSRFLAP